MDVSGMWEPRPGEHFYVTLFASQTTPRVPRLTHSWGTLVHVIDQPGGQAPIIDSQTISWMPTTLQIHPWRLHVEKATNLSLYETLDDVLAKGEHVSQWGPYECRPELYYRTQVQKEFLESGQIGYQMIDTVGEAAFRGDGCDCIHAMTDMDPEFSRNHYPLIRYGESASTFVVRQLRRKDLLLNPSQTHCWLSTCLGLDSYPIIHRQ